MMDTPRIAILSAYDEVCAFLDNSLDGTLHYWDDTLHTYLQGSAYTFEFTTESWAEDAAYLVEGNHLSFKYKDKGYYLNIVEVEKDELEIKVTAYGLVFELLNEEVDTYEGKSMSFESYVKAFYYEKSFDIGINEVSDKRISNKWEGTDTVLKRLYSLATVFSAELEFVTELNDDYSLNRIVLNIYREHDDTHQGMGQDRTGEVLHYGKEVTGITKKSDITELCTAIRPTGKDGLQLNKLSGKKEYDSDGNVEFQVSGNNLLAPQARDRFPSLLKSSKNDRYIAKIWSYDTSDVNVLYGQAKAELMKIMVPKVSYEVESYVDANIGDTFTIEDTNYAPTLYLTARVTEQETCFTDPSASKTTFDNFEEIASQIDQSLIKAMQSMIDAKRTFEVNIISSNGTVFKNGDGSTTLTAKVLANNQDASGEMTYQWHRNGVACSTGQTLSVFAKDITNTVTYRVEAIDANGVVRGSTEVTCANVTDGNSSHIHIAYANSSDGRVDFSLTDSNRKFIGQYSDSKQYVSEDPTKYRWSAIKGEDGQSFVNAEEQFYYSTSQTELIGGEWFVGNVVYQSDKFLWKRWKCTYANPSEIKYTKAIFDNTWNEIEAKIGEIHTQVSQTNTQSKEALGKAEDAEKLATSANELANTANTQSSEAKKLAQDANTSTGNAQKQIDAIKGDITDSKQQIQDAVDKANANATEINSVKETYATKVDLTNESKTIHADVSTEIEKKVGELSTTVSQNYASKSALTQIEGSLNTKIKQNADSITTQASSIEKLQSDTTQAQKDITVATKKATDAQTLADKALGNAQSAQTLADQAKKKADSAQLNLDSANKELADAKANLKSVTGRVGATESEITKAQTRLTDAETAVQKAQSDATKAQGNATTAINNAKTAQGVADDAKQKAEQAQKNLAELTNKVTSNTTKIEQNANAIKLQAKSITETSNKVDNLQIGGRNLLRNAAFNTFKYWNSISAKLEVVDGWCEVTINGTWSGITQNFKPEKGVDYIISYEAYLVDTEATSAFLECDFVSPDDRLAITKNPTNYSKKIPYPTDVANFINFQLQSNEVGKKWRIRNIKLEKGNKATDWTPAPEDVDEAINTERTERQSAIETKANEITSKVSETYVSNSALNHYKEEVSTQFSQTKSNFTWSINRSVTDAKNEINGQISSVNGRLDGLKQTADNVNSYMSFDNDALTLGKSDSAFKTKITNQEWSIQKNGAKVTYINDQTMYITDGQFTQSLKIGNFGFVPRANGSLDFKKIR
nr:MAG TPA: tail protein [Bacteriophage sp.]